MDEYKPISNDILVELEVLTALKKLCTIKFKAENGGTPEIKARILGIYSIDEAQYLKTEDGLSLRLDQILEIDDKILRKNC